MLREHTDKYGFKLVLTLIDNLFIDVYRKSQMKYFIIEKMGRKQEINKNKKKQTLVTTKP